MIFLVYVIALSLFGNFILNLIEFKNRKESRNTSSNQFNVLLRNMALITEKEEALKRDQIESVNKFLKSINSDEGGGAKGAQDNFGNL